MAVKKLKEGSYDRPGYDSMYLVSWEDSLGDYHETKVKADYPQDAIDKIKKSKHIDKVVDVDKIDMFTSSKRIRKADDLEEDTSKKSGSKWGVYKYSRNGKKKEKELVKEFDTYEDAFAYASELRKYNKGSLRDGSFYGTEEITESSTIRQVQDYMNSSDSSFDFKNSGWRNLFYSEKKRLGVDCSTRVLDKDNFLIKFKERVEDTPKWVEIFYYFYVNVSIKVKSGEDPIGEYHVVFDKVVDHSTSSAVKYLKSIFSADMSKSSVGILKRINEDTVKKSNGKWINRGDDGTEHGEFDTKKKADAQRKAMYANGYKGESVKFDDRNKFKVGMIIKHSDFEFPLKITEIHKDRNGEVEGIRVKDYKGTGNEYDLWIDNETLRYEKRVGQVLDKITIVSESKKGNNKMSVNKLKESYSDRHITLKFKSNSTLPYKVYDSLFDLTANGISIAPKYDDIPLGWDSSVDIVGGKVVLEGELVPGGADPGCICKITLSPEKVDNYYDIYVDANEEDYDEVVDLLTKCNLM